MAVTVRTTLRDGTTFVALDGVGDPSVLECIGDAIVDALDDGPVVLDITGVLLVNPDAVRSLVERLRVPALHGGLSIVSSRLSARRMLRQFGGQELAVFASVSAVGETAAT
jgi:hypothetical protein